MNRDDYVRLKVGEDFALDNLVGRKRGHWLTSRPDKVYANGAPRRSQYSTCNFHDSVKKCGIASHELRGVAARTGKAHGALERPSQRPSLPPHGHITIALHVMSAGLVIACMGSPLAWGTGHQNKKLAFGSSCDP